MTDTVPEVTRVGDGMFRVAHNGRLDIVYVAGAGGERWAFWDGQVFRERVQPQRRRPTDGDTTETLRSPMPATVTKVLVQVGTAIHTGDVVLVLEAMKMELPLRSPRDATVTAIHCRVGDLVQPETTLVDLK